MSLRPDVLFAYDFPPLGGGISRWMAEIARRYPKGELIVSTGTLPGSDEADLTVASPVVRLATSSRRLRTLTGQFAWRRQALALDYQHQFGFAWCDNVRPSAYPANSLARARGVPYGVILHGSDLFDLRRNYRRSWFKRVVARRLLGDAAVLVTNSRWTGDLAREVLGELELARSAARVRVVPLGTDPGWFRPGIAPAPFREAHGLPAGPWLVTVARLERYKGADVVIRALRRLADRGRLVHYAIVGEGPAQGELEALAQHEAVADRVHFLGRVPDGSLAQAYALGDLYIGLTRQTEEEVEGFGISLVEAQAMAIPVIAGRGGGTADAVVDGETGLLVDPLDPEAVAGAIETLLADPNRRATMGAAGRQGVERYYNWDRVITELRSIAAALGVRRS